MRALRRVVMVWPGMLVAAVATSSCFFNSEWVEIKETRARAVERATPGTLQPAPQASAPSAEATAPVTRALKVRVRVTPQHSMEVPTWREQLDAMLGDANQLLAPSVNIRLDLAGAEAWTPKVSEDNLERLVDDLAAFDPGQDTDWVLGLAGSVVRVEQSFHQLGVGRLMGKHLILRTMNDAKEYDALRRDLSHLDGPELQQLYRTRKRHKTATVFLHELAHTLGVLHQPDAKSIMHPIYDHKVQGYGDAAVELMRISLERRLQPQARTEHAYAQSLIGLLERTSPIWVASERDALLTRLRAVPPPAAPPPAASAPKSPPASAAAPISGLSDPDQATFAEALEAQRSGRASDAWSKVEPLFSRYPDVYAVQDMRCQLAMKMGGPFAQVQAQCERLMQLTKDMAKTPKKR